MARGAPDTIHLVNAPGLPPGWTKGNWYEWYPDRIVDGKATVATPKPYKDRIDVALFRRNGKAQSVADIANLAPFARIALQPAS